LLPHSVFHGPPPRRETVVPSRKRRQGLSNTCPRFTQVPDSPVLFRLHLRNFDDAFARVIDVRSPLDPVFAGLDPNIAVMEDAIAKIEDAIATIEDAIAAGENVIATGEGVTTALDAFFENRAVIGCGPSLTHARAVGDALRRAPVRAL